MQKQMADYRFVYRCTFRPVNAYVNDDEELKEHVIDISEG